MDRARQRDESCALADLSAGAAPRRVSNVAHWFLALLGLVGLVAVMLATGLDVLAGSDVARADAGWEPGDRPAAAWQLPGDGGAPPSEDAATLDSETDDDDDTHSDSSATAPFSRSIRVSNGRRVASRSRLSVDTGQPLVSTGLARGPPIAS